MQGFIEVTREEDGKKLLINISKIETIYPEEENAAAFISIRSVRKRRGKYHYGVFVKENYEAIKTKIEESTK